MFIFMFMFNPLDAELNPICHMLALLGAHRIFHVSVLRVKKFRGIHRERVLARKWPEPVEGGWQGRGGSGYRAGRREQQPIWRPGAGMGKRYGSCIFPMNNRKFLKQSHSTPFRLWRWNRQSVPKRRHIKFRRRGITQKKGYNNAWFQM
jgi:hypothetical protein